MSNTVAAHFAMVSLSTADRATERALRVLAAAAALRASKVSK